MRLIDADALKRKSQKVATEAWKLRIKATVEVILNQFIDYIDAAPTIKPEPQWIPCSERLPETDGEVLITVLDMEEDYVEVYKGFYQDQEWWTQWCHGCLKIKDEPCGENIVTAWMPLPEPYGGEQDDSV